MNHSTKKGNKKGQNSQKNFSPYGNSDQVGKMKNGHKMETKVLEDKYGNKQILFENNGNPKAVNLPGDKNLIKG